MEIPKTERQRRLCLNVSVRSCSSSCLGRFVSVQSVKGERVCCFCLCQSFFFVSLPPTLTASPGAQLMHTHDTLSPLSPSLLPFSSVSLFLRTAHTHTHTHTNICRGGEERREEGKKIRRWRRKERGEQEGGVTG